MDVVFTLHLVSEREGGKFDEKPVKIAKGDSIGTCSTSLVHFIRSIVLIFVTILVTARFFYPIENASV